jgi:O-acetylserine/cysteine efflux transporter
MRPVDIGIVLLVVTIWGGNFIAMRIGALEIPPYFLLALRLSIAALALAWFVRSPRGMILPLLGISFTMCILHFGLALVGLKHVEAGAGSLAMQAAVPFAALLAWIFFGETFGWRRILGVALAFAGLTMISGVPQLGERSDMFLLMVISALCFSVATIQIRHLGNKNFISINAWVCIFSAPMAFLVSWVFEAGQWNALMVAQTPTILGIFYMGLIASVFGQGLWYRLLPRYQTNQVMPYTLLVPVLGILFGIVFLDETLNWELVVGGIITITGVAIIVLRSSDKVKQEKLMAKQRNEKL